MNKSNNILILSSLTTMRSRWKQTRHTLFDVNTQILLTSLRGVTGRDVSNRVGVWLTGASRIIIVFIRHSHHMTLRVLRNGNPLIGGRVVPANILLAFVINEMTISLSNHSDSIIGVLLPAFGSTIPVALITKTINELARLIGSDFLSQLDKC